MRLLPVFLTFLLILTACAAPAQPTTAPVTSASLNFMLLFLTEPSRPVCLSQNGREVRKAICSFRSILPPELLCLATRRFRWDTLPTMLFRPTGKHWQL